MAVDANHVYRATGDTIRVANLDGNDARDLADHVAEDSGRLVVRGVGGGRPVVGRHPPRPRALIGVQDLARSGAGRPGEPGRRHAWLGIPSCVDAVDHPDDRSGSVGSCLGQLGASGVSRLDPACAVQVDGDAAPIKQLGIKPGQRAAVINPPDGHGDRIDPPEGVEVTSDLPGRGRRRRRGHHARLDLHQDGLLVVDGVDLVGDPLAPLVAEPHRPPDLLGAMVATSTAWPSSRSPGRRWARTLSLVSPSTVAESINGRAAATTSRSS